MIKAYLLDMDEVLVDNSKSDPKIYGEAYKNISENTGRRIGEIEKEMKSFSTLSLEYFDWNTKILKLGGTVKLEDLHKKYSSLIKAYSDVKPTISKLKSGNKMIYTVSNGFRTFQEIKLQASGLEGLFDGLFTSDDLGVIKQNPMFFQKLLKKIKTNLEEVVLVDDVELPLVTAKNLGIKTVRMHRGGGRAETNADYLIHTLTELPEIKW